jgi:aldehyde dehydrogenase (NAD+)
MAFEQLIEKQQEFFETQKTKNLSFRKENLKRLLYMIETNQDAIEAALATDLGKPPIEAFLSETGFVMGEIRHLLKNLHKWTRSQNAGFEWLKIGPARARIVREPLGRCLILAPWNYPFQLTIAPLAGALAAGNTAVVKFSEFAPATAALMEKLIKSTFPEAYVAVVSGDAQTAIALLNLRWDMIFFTGSTPVGKKVMAAAAKNLTPVVLELGGKSPVYVDASANLEIAAKRIAWGKYLNAGQTCIAPDYILVHQEVATELETKVKAAFASFQENADKPAQGYGKIVNEKHFKRLLAMLPEEDQAYCNSESLYFPPTLLKVSDWQHPAMQEEIFGPILPFIQVAGYQEAMQYILKNEKPLALYVFSSNNAVNKAFERGTSSGSLVFNDTVVQISHNRLPFGGVGFSGMGRYHGAYSIQCFSHEKAVLANPTWLDIPFRYPPYSKFIQKILRKII